MPLEAGDVAGQRLRVVHRGVDQVVEIEVLDVEGLAHMRAARPQELDDLGLVVAGSNCVFTASGAVMT